MTKTVMSCSIIAVFVAILVVPVFASSIKAEVKINQKIHVNLEFSSLDTADYTQIFENGEYQVLTEMADAFKRILEQQTVEFNNETNTIKIAFYLPSYDIFDIKIDTEKASKPCKIKTDWRKVQLNLSDTVSFDLSKYFGKPVAQWQNFTDDDGRMHFENSYSDQNLSASFSFILPSSAKNVYFAADQETILFELPLSFEDQLLNSPLLILIVLTIIVCAVLVYQRIVR